MPLPPKHPSARQRRNRTSTAATLRPVVDVQVPELPETDEGWHPLTVAWWGDVWGSPMSAEFDPSDVHGLFVLAALVDAFWTKPSASLAGEIRLQRQCFGLTPIDRRRLQWEIDRGEGAEESRRARAEATRPERKDLRSTLAV